MSNAYLFDNALLTACRTAGLLNQQGKPTITAHRFRHTVGTQIAERGARLQTIMSILGHKSVQMALVYANVSDPAVLDDYRTVLGPDATIAGPSRAAQHGPRRLNRAEVASLLAIDPRTLAHAIDDGTSRPSASAAGEAGPKTRLQDQRPRWCAPEFG